MERTSEGPTSPPRRRTVPSPHRPLAPPDPMTATARPRPTARVPFPAARVPFPATLAALALLVALPSALAAQQPLPLELGETVEGTLATGDTARYAIEAGADFFVRGWVDQIGVDVVVRVLDPEGDQVGRFLLQADDSQQVFVLGEDEPRRVAVTAVPAAEAGDESLEVALRFTEPRQTELVGSGETLEIAGGSVGFDGRIGQAVIPFECRDAEPELASSVVVRGRLAQ